MAEVLFSEKNHEMIVNGEITFATVKQLRRQGDELLRQFHGKAIHINFQNVTHHDITGLALAIAWLRTCKQLKIKMILSHLPASIVRIAEVCDITDLLNLSD